MKVADVMAQDPITVADDATVSQAVQRMDQEGIRHLAVTRDGALVGVLSDRDLLASAGRLVPRLGDELTLDPGIVRDVMQAEPLTVAPEESAARAAELLVTWGVGCLPVVQDRALVGLLTESDLLDAFASSCTYGRRAGDDDPPVERLMTAAVATVGPQASLEEVARRMAEGDFRHLPVVEDGRLVGIVSDRDLRRATGRGLARETPVGAAMSTRISTTEASAPLSRAARHMAQQQIGALPVVGPGRALAGILTVSDVLRHCARVLAR